MILKNSSFEIVDSKILEVKKDDNLKIIADKEYEIDGIFVALELQEALVLLKNLALK